MTRTSQINLAKTSPYLAPGIAGFFTFVVTPLVFSFIISLFSQQPHGIPTLVNIKNYANLFNSIDSTFMKVLLSTTISAVFYTTLSLALSTLIAVWLHSIRDKLADLFRVISLVPAVAPMVVNVLIWRLTFDKNGAVNASLSISDVSSVPWLASELWTMVALVMMSLQQIIGYNIVALGSELDDTNPSVPGTARVDGTGPFKRFFKAIFPLLSPALFFYTVMVLIGALRISAQPYMLTGGGPGDSTTTIALYLYNQGFSYDKLGYASTVARVLFVIVMLTTVFQPIGQKK